MDFSKVKTSLGYIGSSRSVKVTYNKTCLKEDKTNKQTKTESGFILIKDPSQLLHCFVVPTTHSQDASKWLLLCKPGIQTGSRKKARKAESQQLGFHCKWLPRKSTPLLTYVFIGWDIKSLTTARNKKEYGHSIWLPIIKAGSFGEEEERWKAVRSHYVAI